MTSYADLKVIIPTGGRFHKECVDGDENKTRVCYLPEEKFDFPGSVDRQPPTSLR